jgi:hypothetical protein
MMGLPGNDSWSGGIRWKINVLRPGEVPQEKLALGLTPDFYRRKFPAIDGSPLRGIERECGAAFGPNPRLPPQL